MKTCKTCGKNLLNRNRSGLCRLHYLTDPEQIAKRNDWQLQHIDKDLHDDYRFLTRKKRYSAFEAYKIITGVTDEVLQK